MGTYMSWKVTFQASWHVTRLVSWQKKHDKHKTQYTLMIIIYYNSAGLRVHDWVDFTSSSISYWYFLLSYFPNFWKKQLTLSHITLNVLLLLLLIERELASRAHQRILRWFGHVERMDKYRMGRRVLMAEVNGARVRGRQRLGWIDGVKVALSNSGMTVEAARQCEKRSEGVESPSTCVTEWISRGHFCLALGSFGPPSRALVVITWRGVGCR